MIKFLRLIRFVPADQRKKRRVIGIQTIAKEAGVNRRTLYRLINGERLNWETLLQIIPVVTEIARRWESPTLRSLLPRAPQSSISGRNAGEIPR